MSKTAITVLFIYSIEIIQKKMYVLIVKSAICKGSEQIHLQWWLINGQKLSFHRMLVRRYKQNPWKLTRCMTSISVGSKKGKGQLADTEIVSQICKNEMTFTSP